MDESKETTEPMQLPTDAPMDENEGIMTFDDWTKAQEEEEAMETELIRAAETLLGSQDDRVCTYPEGNKKRQAIYSCVTCRTDDSKPAGICYGCSIHCHDGHDLVELYTKRNFCCDCGNSKFPSKCKLYEDKIAENKRNTYNQNFFDKYCECHKPYPMEENDPDYHLEMCQCFACEDWFHREHIISGNIPQRFLDGELICRGCTATLPFVAFYHQNWEKLLSTPGSTSSCLLEHWTKPEVFSTFEFPSSQWRNTLCKCSKCMAMYDDLLCEYLMDEEDTIDSYEKGSREALEKERLQAGTSDNIVSRLVEHAGREQAVEVIQGFNHMKDELGKFFASFTADKVVTKEDVSKFFDGLKQSRASQSGL